MRRECRYVFAVKAKMENVSRSLPEGRRISQSGTVGVPLQYNLDRRSEDAQQHCCLPDATKSNGCPSDSAPDRVCACSFMSCDKVNALKSSRIYVICVAQRREKWCVVITVAQWGWWLGWPCGRLVTGSQASRRKKHCSAVVITSLLHGLQSWDKFAYSTIFSRGNFLPRAEMINS